MDWNTPLLEALGKVTVWHAFLGVTFWVIITILVKWLQSSRKENK